MEILNEAEAVKANQLPMTGEEAIDNFARDFNEGRYPEVDDEIWNKAFVKYSGFKGRDEKLYYLKASKMQDKNGNVLSDGERKVYIKLTGKTGEQSSAGKSNPLARLVGLGGPHSWATIELSQLEVTDDPNLASVFTSNDAEDVVQAIQKNKDIKTFGVRFTKEAVPAEALSQNYDYARMIYRKYFNKACGVDDNSGIDFLRSGESALYTLSRGFRKPLAGNDFLKIFSNAYKNASIKANVVVESNMIYLFRDLIADRYFGSKGLWEIDTFEKTLLFNANVLRQKADVVEEVLDRYIDAYNFVHGGGTIANSSLEEWREKDPQLARNLLLIHDSGDTDSFKEAVLTDASIDVADLPLYKANPSDENVLKERVRSATAIDNMMEKLGMIKEDTRISRRRAETPEAREDTSFNPARYLDVDPETGTDEGDARKNVRLKSGDRFVGFDGKIYIANVDGLYDIKKDSKVYLERR